MPAIPEIPCPVCRNPIPWEAWNSPLERPCFFCSARIAAQVFPAAMKGDVPPTASAAIVPGESSCFHHAARAAAVVCDGCGRFLCELCDIALGERHLCPACVEASGAKGGRSSELVNERLLWDEIALTFSLLPLLTCWCAIFTAPIAFPAVYYLTVRHWRSPSSVVPRTKIRFLLASGIATLGLLAWGAWIIVLVGGAQW